MSDNPTSPLDLKAVWKSQPRQTAPIAPQIVRRNAKRLQRRRLFVVVREALGCGAAIAASVFITPILPGLLLKVGYGLLGLFAVFYFWRLVALLRPRRVPDDTAACLDFHRRELERQRDIARGIWRWTTVPAVPIVMLIFVGLWFGPGAVGRARWLDHLVIAAEVVVTLEGWLLIWIWNQHRADLWQDQIDELNALGQEDA